VYVLSGGNRALTLFSCALLATRLAFGSATVNLSYELKTWANFRLAKGTFFTVVIGLALSSVVDLWIALILMYYLWRSKTGFDKSVIRCSECKFWYAMNGLCRRTDYMLHVLMAYCVNTGLITMICSTVIIFTFVFMKSSLLFAGFVQISMYKLTD